jgi:hypothetical protein
MTGAPPRTTRSSSDKRKSINVETQTGVGDKETNLEFHDLLDAVTRLAHPTHFLVQGADASTDAFRRPRCGGHFAREHRRFSIESIDMWEKRLEAGERVKDRFLVGKERGERIRYFGFLGFERGERGEDLGKGC